MGEVRPGGGPGLGGECRKPPPPPRAAKVKRNAPEAYTGERKGPFDMQDPQPVELTHTSKTRHYDRLVLSCRPQGPAPVSFSCHCPVKGA